MAACLQKYWDMKELDPTLHNTLIKAGTLLVHPFMDEDRAAQRCVETISPWKALTGFPLTTE